MEKKLYFVDSEITRDGKIADLGAISENGEEFHSASQNAFSEFIKNADFVCGHNVIHFDCKYIAKLFPQNKSVQLIDTLYLSPLLFPKKPYHKLVKDDKLQSEELNNPLNDSIKARDLFYDELNAFRELSSRKQWIYCNLLYRQPEFQGFFRYIGYKPYPLYDFIIADEFKGLICYHADIYGLMKNYPVELAYALALIGSDDRYSITPPWLLRNYPRIENVLKILCNTPCEQGCDYCNEKLNVYKGLNKYFGYEKFREFDGEPLQEKAVRAAVDGKSLLTVFPTGGGKSLTFQLPALMAGEAVNGLTVVIAPLQSLMKDQVDNLEAKGIPAVTVNGLLSPVERAEAIRQVREGIANLLYIAPEQLRSKTIEKLLMSRNVVRFVIDEAHCFSAWGQDFRVDYLYIGDFIKQLQEKKNLAEPIPVSCFTATAKRKVITDICDYFRRKLDINLELFTTNATRKNLHYTVLHQESEEVKYNTLRTLIETKNCPTIVYVSRTKRTVELAQKLTNDGFPAKPFNGKMEPTEKIENQNAFIRNEVQIIVATSAFGMGVDKKDVKLVIHYDISDSLENYVQEAGRAGRDENLQAECYVLFNNEDLNKHFILFNQSKLSMGDIQQVWKAIKDLSKGRNTITCSALELARQAGWDDSIKEIETRIKTAVAALENAGYVERGRNVPRVFANGILAKNMQEAATKLDSSDLFSDEDRQTARRIIKSLISSRSIAEAGNDEAESRVDYIADNLGIPKQKVIGCINQMRQIGLLADTQDMSAYILRNDTQNRSLQILNKFEKMERFILSQVDEEGSRFNVKELNDTAIREGLTFSTIRNLRTILYFWSIKSYTRKTEYNTQNCSEVVPAMGVDKLSAKLEKRIEVCRFIVEELYRKSSFNNKSLGETILVQFSLVGLLNAFNETPRLIPVGEVVLSDIEDALLYLAKIGALNLQGGFLVAYNGMEIKRLIIDNKIRYKQEDYRMLNEHYKQKIQQIHIVGEYANLMVNDYETALQFVYDYFNMDYKKFIAQYFKGERAAEIERSVTPEKYHQLFDALSDRQSEIMNDSQSKYIVVAAGPGSGKTRILVHKLASLLMLEDVKHEQLLMVTFSRAAATDFKKKIMKLVGNAASFVEIKTFHSYCFDLLGKIGSLEESEDVVKDAAEMILNGDVEMGRISKAVVVIDEAQDMDENEFALIKALISRNEDMRVVAVGDDDQNIYEFRGSDSKYLRELIEDYGAKQYELTENFRSCQNIVKFANKFATLMNNRMKQQECVAVKSEDGVVELIHHSGCGMGGAIVEQILSKPQQGSVCVLTSTNDEALRVVSLLNKHNRRAKLIQSLEGFNLVNLAEVRFFIDEISKENASPVISDNVWRQAKARLVYHFKDSECLSNCLKMLADFEAINKTKYRTDFMEFVTESNYEDFYEDEKDSVIVSTIHKAKGREFDIVYVLLNNVSLRTEEEKRRLYVGFTRAKNELYIHFNNGLFGDEYGSIANYIEDGKQYEDATEAIVQLTYKDVFLDYFKERQYLIAGLYSGSNLQVDGDYLLATYNGKLNTVARFSKAFKEKLNSLQMNGYRVDSASVKFVVYWRPKGEDRDYAILLPELILKKG